MRLGWKEGFSSCELRTSIHQTFFSLGPRVYVSTSKTRHAIELPVIESFRVKLFRATTKPPFFLVPRMGKNELNRA